MDLKFRFIAFFEHSFFGSKRHSLHVYFTITQMKGYTRGKCNMRTKLPRKICSKIARNKLSFQKKCRTHSLQLRYITWSPKINAHIKYHSECLMKRRSKNMYIIILFFSSNKTVLDQTFIMSIHTIWFLTMKWPETNNKDELTIVKCISTPDHAITVFLKFK